MLCLTLFLKVNKNTFVLGCGPGVVTAYFAVRLRIVAVKFENMEALFDVTLTEPTMVVVHNKRGYKRPGPREFCDDQKTSVVLTLLRSLSQRQSKLRYG